MRNGIDPNEANKWRRAIEENMKRRPVSEFLDPLYRAYRGFMERLGKRPMPYEDFKKANKDFDNIFCHTPISGPGRF